MGSFQCNLVLCLRYYTVLLCRQAVSDHGCLYREAGSPNVQLGPVLRISCDNTLQCNAMHCNAMQGCVVSCDNTLSNAMQCWAHCDTLLAACCSIKQITVDTTSRKTQLMITIQHCFVQQNFDLIKLSLQYHGLVGATLHKSTSFFFILKPKLSHSPRVGIEDLF